eukprot:gnl/MRDRNA2_/MRDRNA2_47596_c0_seq1.p1 gnl/MRDRNA2_/MRDRNA2_47596_c0~~gnl/MRDRNA2_/MRDRNA2_47596_c0_seq1.p1  ORF type:complete len:117 (-),score=26.97 gnl/MRDRNA2_/MRDRNA2_47596_c0_seq1:272-622(-)
MLQVPLIVLTMGYLLWMYAKLDDKRPLVLQLVGMLFILHYPMHELVATEIASGGMYDGDAFVPSEIWKGLYPDGMYKALLHMIGVAFTIAASCLALHLPKAKEEALHEEGVNGEAP